MKYRYNGKTVTKTEFDRLTEERKRFREGLGQRETNRGRYPVFASEALGVHPRNIKKQQEIDRKQGVEADGWTPDGRPEFKSHAKWREYVKASGYHDRGFGMEV